MSDASPTVPAERVDRAHEIATLQQIDADVSAIDAAMRLAEDGDLDAAEAVADQLTERAPEN